MSISTIFVQRIISTPIYNTTCDLCIQVISSSYFVCRICAHIDICSFCVEKYPFHSRLHPNQKHETFKLSYMLSRETLPKKREGLVYILRFKFCYLTGSVSYAQLKVKT
ncbi:hypothetical protein N7467_004160 [Penicillium canescens]|nr:hypothetical protein N7467_004160 [Penicillium canescens]